MIGYAIIGRWHVHAPDYFKQASALGAVCRGVWDADETPGRKWAEERGLEFYADLDELLAKDDFDSVIICTATAIHRDVMIKAANAGKHIFTEKTLAPTLTECYEIADAIKKNNVKFEISYPQRTQPSVLYAKQVIDSDVLGRITLGRFRNAHGGASMGWLPDYWYEAKDACGGAMMDLGCHSMYIAAHLFGKPARISSMFNDLTGHGVDDNAVNTIEFENKVIAIVETSFVSPISPWAFEIYGTNGYLCATDNKVTLKTTAGAQEVTDLPSPLDPPLTNFFKAVEGIAEVQFGLDDAIDLARLLENAYISDKQGITVNIK